MITTLIKIVTYNNGLIETLTIINKVKNALVRKEKVLSKEFLFYARC